MDDGAHEDRRALSKTESRSRFRRPWSRLCYGFLGILFFVMMAISLVALGLFAAKHNNIAKELKREGDNKCILYTTKDTLEKNRLSGGAGCRFTTWGCGIVAVGAGIFMLGYIFKTLYGASASSWLVCVELPLLLLLLLASLTISINTTVGLSLACRGFNDASSNNKSIFDASGSNCKDYTVEGIKFYNDMIASGIMSWCITGALLLVVVLYIGLNMLFCRRCTGSEDDEANQALLEPAAKRENKQEKNKAKEKKTHSKITSNSGNNPFL